MRNINIARNDFPLICNLDKQHLVYLDSAATSQKPNVVLTKMVEYYRTANANPRRGTSLMSSKTTDLVESARQNVALFLNAKSSSSIVFTKSTTESINLVALGFVENMLQKDDQILITEMEHHSNMLPWQRAAKKTGATLVYLAVDKLGQIDMDEFRKSLSKKTKIVAIAHVSNVFGSTLPLKEIIKEAHAVGALVFVDGAQAVAHYSIDVTDLDVDFYAFSSHKMYGPMSVGVLYAKPEHLQRTDPLLLGGSMVTHVSKSFAEYAPVPFRFEGGTQDVAGIIGLSASINYIHQFSWNSIVTHEQKLIKRLRNQLDNTKDVSIYAGSSGSIISFAIQKAHPHDVAQVLDSDGVTVRSGHHCAEPLMQSLKLPGVVRVSVGIYNNESDIDQCAKAIKKATHRFSRG